MKDFVGSIIKKDLSLAESILKERIAEIVESKLHEMKKMMAARDFVKEQYPTGRSKTRMYEEDEDLYNKHRDALNDVNATVAAIKAAKKSNAADLPKLRELHYRLAGERDKLKNAEKAIERRQRMGIKKEQFDPDEGIGGRISKLRRKILSKNGLAEDNIAEMKAKHK